MRLTAFHLVILGAAGAVSLPIALAQSRSDHGAPITLVRGAGTTLIEGGTGRAGGFLPVETTIAFHAERNSIGGVTGDFECFARVPETPVGPGSAQFTLNAMYVTGQVKTVVIAGDIAILSGTAEITGLGAGSSVPFTLVVRGGGPGATAELTTNGITELVFREILLQGSFEIYPGRHEQQQANITIVDR